jgi:hypothetical protein
MDAQNGTNVQAETSRLDYGPDGRLSIQPGMGVGEIPPRAFKTRAQQCVTPGCRNEGRIWEFQVDVSGGVYVMPTLTCGGCDNEPRRVEVERLTRVFG